MRDPDILGNNFASLHFWETLKCGRSRPVVGPEYYASNVFGSLHHHVWVCGPSEVWSHPLYELLSM